MSEFTNSFLGLDHVKLNSIFASVAVGITTVTGYLYNDPITIYTLLALYGFDFVTGVGAAYVEKKISSTKIPRVLMNMVFMLGLLGISWWMSKTNLMFSFLPGIVVGGAYSTLLVSVIENLARMKVLPAAVETLIKKRFGLRVLQDLEKDSK